MTRELTLQIDRDGLFAELDQLATFSDAPAPAVTRVLWSATDRQGRDSTVIAPGIRNRINMRSTRHSWQIGIAAIPTGEQIANRILARIESCPTTQFGASRFLAASIPARCVARMNPISISATIGAAAG
jgi:hypothetical protein